MSLVLLIAIPFAGGLLAWLVSRWSAVACRWTALAASLAGLGLAVGLWVRYFAGPAATLGSKVFALHFDVSWIPQAGIRFHLAVDGLSVIMLLLTFAVVTLALLASWTMVRHRTGLFHFQLLWAAAALAGVFMALDLFLFYFFFEMMLVPFYFLIALWGHEQRRRAAIKFFIYTQAGGLLMLISIVALYFLHGRQSGVYTFDYLQLLGTSFSGSTGLLLMLGFFVAFAVKLPAVPLHGWLPDAHSQANTAGSVLLAGLLIKVGAYGLLRFLVPLFPRASFDIRYIAMGVGVAGILYGALMAFAQTDLKRMVAYTSVSHMGFVLLGVFAWNELALQGVVLQIVCHAFSTGGLFILAGVLEERLGTRDLGGMGGLWARLSTLGGFGMFLAMAALGLPGLGNFVAEFLILLGTFQVSRPAAIVASLGLVLATVYAVWLVQRVFHGPAATLDRRSEREGRGLSVREMVLFGSADRRAPVARAVSAGPSQDHEAGQRFPCSGRLRSPPRCSRRPAATAPTASADARDGAPATEPPDALARRYRQRGQAVSDVNLLALSPYVALASTAVVVMLVSVLLPGACAIGRPDRTPVSPPRSSASLRWPALPIGGPPPSCGWTISRSTSPACWSSSPLPSWRCRTGTCERTERRVGDFYALLTFATLGGVVLLASAHFASFFLGLEVLTVSLYGLIAYPRQRPQAVEAGFKYLVLAGTTSAFLLFGMALVYAGIGHDGCCKACPPLAGGSPAGRALRTDRAGADLHRRRASSWPLVPFHLWTPDVYQGGPAPVTAFLATVSKAAVFVVLLQFLRRSILAVGAVLVVFTIVG